MLKLLASLNDYNFYENNHTGTYAVYRKNKPIAHPVLLEDLIEKIDNLSELSPNNTTLRHNYYDSRDS